MQWSDKDKTAIEQHLNELLLLGRQMLAALMEEYDALYEREPPSPDVIERKATLAQQMATAQQAYFEFISTLNGQDVRATLEASAPDLLPLLDETKSMLQQCDRHNQINGRLLARTHLKNQLFGRLLKSHLPEPTYSRGGQMTENSGATLGKA
ncbi:MAG: flagellar export chaperone FlgN [Natronospirillum sp.]